MRKRSTCAQKSVLLRKQNSGIANVEPFPKAPGTTGGLHIFTNSYPIVRGQTPQSEETVGLVVPRWAKGSLMFLSKKPTA